MTTVIEDMPAGVVTSSRAATSPFHQMLAVIQQTPEYHRKLKQLARFDLPEQKNKAHQRKQYLADTYGNKPEILGFTFMVARSPDGKHEFLGVTYDPSKIVEGLYESWRIHRDKKAAESKAKRALKVEAAAEITQLEDKGDYYDAEDESEVGYAGSR